MRNYLNWHFLLFIGITLIGCQDDITVNNPANSGVGLNKIYLLSGSLGDFMWYDTNMNGQADTGEGGVPYADVELYDCNTGLRVATAKTSQWGYYLFDNIPEGDYKIKFIAPLGYSFTIQNASGVSYEYDSDAAINGFTECIHLINENDITLDAGLVETTSGSASIGDFVWNDIDKDGRQDENELGIKDVKVELYDCNSNYLNKFTATDINGNYRFDNLAVGNYKVKFILPAGYSFSPIDKNNNDTKDSDVRKDGFTDCINVSENKEDLRWDAGLHHSKKVYPRSYGYWKTHSMYGPAKYDPTWALIGEDTPFFYANKTWYEVIKMKPRKGNVYYILAHQFIAARLNELAGVNVPSKVTDALFKATALFDNPENTPTHLEKQRGNAPLRKEFLKLSKLLHKFNDGKKNHGHFGHD